MGPAIEPSSSRQPDPAGGCRATGDTSTKLTFKVSGRWTYLYRAVDQHGQVIDVTLSKRRDLPAARTFFTHALAVGITPMEVTTDRAPAYPRVPDEHVPAALHVVEQYANNPIEADTVGSKPGSVRCAA